MTPDLNCTGFLKTFLQHETTIIFQSWFRADTHAKKTKRLPCSVWTSSRDCRM